MTWNSLAEDNRAASHELFLRRRWRSCTNRAYFAAYSAATHVLLQVPIQMPAGNEGPTHKPLPGLIGHNLTMLKLEKSWQVSELVYNLYKLRLLADYHPSIEVDINEARIAIGMMNDLFRLLEKWLPTN